MDVFEIISRDVFASLIKNVSETTDREEELGHVLHGREISADSADHTTTGSSEDTESESTPNILDILPTEILHHILRFLPRNDLCTLRLVCQKMKAAASDPEVLKVEIGQYLSPSELELKEVEPILANITSMILYGINTKPDPDVENLPEINYEEDEIPGKTFQKLDTMCINIESIRLESTVIPSSVSMSVHGVRLAERLTRLEMYSVTFKNIGHFLPAACPRLEHLLVQECHMEGEAPLESLSEIRMPKLKSLQVWYMENFGDKEFRLLTQNNLGNLKELNLIGLNMNGEDFEKLNLINLRQLDVTTCEFNDEWLSQLRQLRQLTSLRMSSITFKDMCARDTFKPLAELTHLHVDYCNIGNRIVSAMARYLPKLKHWDLKANEDGTVTDEAFAYMVAGSHAELEEAVFDRVQMTDIALRQLVLSAPNLTELSLSACAAGDESMELVGKLQSLVKLTLRGARMTDVGFAALEPRFAALEELTVHSRFLTEAGLMKSLSLLTKCRMVSVVFGEPECDFTCYRGNSTDGFSYITVKGLSSDVMLVLLEQFKNATSITFENMKITEQELERIGACNPDVENFTTTNCDMTDLAADSFGKNLLHVKYINFYRSQTNDDILLRLFKSMMSCDKFENFNFEITPFPSNEILKVTLPIVTHCNNFEFRTVEYDRFISIRNATDYYLINVSGGGQMDHSIIFEIAKLLPESTALDFSNVEMTTRGLKEIAAILPKMNTLTMQSATMGDDAMSIIGHDFPALTSMNIACENVTDEGLDAFGKQFQTVESLTIRHTAITDDGIRRLVPKLTAIKYLSLYDNNKVTRELYDYMTTTYPNLDHDYFPEPVQPEGDEPDENHEANGGQEEDAADPVVPVVVDEVVRPVEEDNIEAIRPAQEDIAEVVRPAEEDNLEVQVLPEVLADVGEQLLPAPAVHNARSD